MELLSTWKIPDFSFDFYCYIYIYTNIAGKIIKHKTFWKNVARWDDPDVNCEANNGMDPLEIIRQHYSAKLTFFLLTPLKLDPGA